GRAAASAPAAEAEAERSGAGARDRSGEAAGAAAAADALDQHPIGAAAEGRDVAGRRGADLSAFAAGTGAATHGEADRARARESAAHGKPARATAAADALRQDAVRLNSCSPDITGA